jgi:hypothetical protein
MQMFERMAKFEKESASPSSDLQIFPCARTAPAHFGSPADGRTDDRLLCVQTIRCEVGADHLQTVPTRFVRAQHQRRRLDCLLDDWDLALVELEINQLSSSLPVNSFST